MHLYILFIGTTKIFPSIYNNYNFITFTLCNIKELFINLISDKNNWKNKRKNFLEFCNQICNNISRLL